MLHALILLAQEHVEEEASKTPYYIAGGVLASFAVIISAIGIRGHENFPPSKGGRNGVIALAALLVAATMASAVLTG
ncbi:MAG TPA: hypothetical protein VFX51_04605 [Solirubrobacteraceae bacterium]|nr:hypothetical protein [Solirubrobacteraceae bacterium]